MLKPRDEILLDVVGEVLRNGLAEVRRETDARFAQIAPPPDVAGPIAELNGKFCKQLDERLGCLAAVDTSIGLLHERMVAVEAKPEPDLGPLTEKIAALEARPDPANIVGPVNEMAHAIAALNKGMAALPPPVDLTPLEAKVTELDERCALLPLPITEEIHTLRKSVDARFDALPPPQKGDPGDKGDKGSPGEPGKSVTVDDVRDLLDTAFAKWALDVERRIMDMAQKAIDRMPQPVNGVDGLSFDDIEFVSVDERTLECRGIRDGVVVKTHTHRFAVPLDEGVWKAGTEYQRGAGVTWGGSWFIAQVENPKGRPEQSPDWRLAVKHGRDGKNGSDGKRGEKGDAGPRGQNLTALMPDGSRFP